MPTVYISRSNVKYYLKIVKTKSGKQQYCATSKISEINPEELLEEVPNGYEFHESPKSGQVTLRKIPIYNTTEEEVALLNSVMKNHKTVKFYFIERGVNDLIIYISTHSNKNDDNPYSSFVNFFPFRYEEGMKFEKKGNIYNAQRFCYRSSNYGWITMESSKDLNYLAEKYCYHIDKESLFDFGIGF